MLSSLQSIPPALCFFVPLFALILILRILILNQQRRFLLLSWFALLSLAALASAAGVLGLNATTGLFSLSKAQLVIENVLYAELGVSTLYLTSKYSSPVPWLLASKHIKPYTLLLSSFLFCATVIGLATPFVPAIPVIIPPLIFLLFTLSTLPLLAHLIHASLFPPVPSSRAKKSSKLSKPRKKPTKPSVTIPNSTSLPRLTMPTNNNTAITVLIPPPLPSPASSSASFPSSSDQTHQPHSESKHSKDHYGMVEEIGTMAGSSCSTAVLSAPNKPAKLHNDSESGCATTFAGHMNTDLEANPRLTAFTPATTPSGLAIGIRKRATRLCTRSRSILITLLISQSLALLSGALLLVLGVSDDVNARGTPLLRIIETVFIVLCVCGFIFAFYLHGLPLDHHPPPSQGPATPGSMAIAAAQRQDQYDIAPGTKHRADGEDEDAEEAEEAEVKDDMMPHFPDGGNCPEKSKAINPAIGNLTRTYGLGIDKVPFRIFSSTKFHYRQQDCYQGQHERFASASSSFSSPRPKRPPIVVFDQVHDDEKNQEVEDEGIELPVLTRGGYSAHLPSPPDTPRVKGAERFWPGHQHYPYHQQQEEMYFDQEEVRVGIMRPEMKVNVVREFEEPGRYLEVEADVIDTAVSEPGCTSSSVGGDIVPVLTEPRSPRVWFSKSAVLPMMAKSPTSSFAASPKPPSTRSLTLSPKSPTFSIFRSPTSPTSPPTYRSASTSAWRKAERIKAKLRRPLTVHHVARSLSSNMLPEARMEEFSPPSRDDTNGHRRTGSSRVGEWYPFTSKTKLKGDKEREVFGERIGREGQGQEMEMADFVDLTDPFASPTPGFALPKWINGAAGSSSDAGRHSAEHTAASGGYEVGSAKGKERQREAEDMESEEMKEMTVTGNGAVMVMSRTTAWGRVPVIVGSEQGYDREAAVTDFPGMLRRTEERGRDDVKRKAAMKDTHASRRVRRPDSPMPLPVSSSTAYPRAVGVGAMNSAVDDVVDTSGNLGISLNGGLKRVDSRMRRIGSRQSLRSEEGPSSFKSPAPITSPPHVQFPIPGEECDVFGDGSRGGFGRRETRSRRVRNGSPIPLGTRTKTSLRRKGSPVPIPFRSSPGNTSTSRRYKEVEITSSTATPGGIWSAEKLGRSNTLKRHLTREEVEVELNLEEMLLAQRLLRRLDSVYRDP